MADKQKISCGSMKRDAEELETLLKNVPQLMETIKISMRKLANCWEGPAWETFQVQVNKDIQNMNDVYIKLTELQKKLGQGSNIYLSTEDKVNAAFRSIWL